MKVKKVMVVLGVLILAAVVTATAGCTGNDGGDTDILGNWESDYEIENPYLGNSHAAYKFYDDNTGDEIWDDGSESVSFEFTWDDEGSGNYKITFSNDQSKEFEITGDTLTDENGCTYHSV